MRRVAVLFPAAIGTVCAVYTGVYLVRWEWNRAIIAGLFFVSAEVIVAAIVVLDRLRRTEERVVTLLTAVSSRLDDDRARIDLDHESVLGVLREAAPEPPDRFAWLRGRSGSMNVFLPVLLGAGVVASALAWAIEHVARATVSPVLERRLAHQLDVLALPAGGLLAPPTATSVRRRASWLRRVGVLAGVVAVGAVTALALDFVADRTQTRPDVRDPQAQTELELELRGAVADRDPERAFGHLWSVCTGPDVFRSQTLPPPRVEHAPGNVVHVRVGFDVGEHGLERLRGCLNDATLDRVQARVVESRIG